MGSPITPDPFTRVYDAGEAVGFSDIKNDVMRFTFRDEKFEFPTIKSHPLAKWNGYFYTAPIEELRALKEK